MYTFEQKLEYSFLRSQSCQLWKRILQSVYENRPSLLLLAWRKESIAGRESNKLIQSCSKQPTIISFKNSSIYWSVQPVLTDGLHCFFYLFSLLLPQFPPSAATNPGFANNPLMSNLNPSTALDFSVSVSVLLLLLFQPLQWQPVIWLDSLYLSIRNCFFELSFQTVLSVKCKLKALLSSCDLWGIVRIHLT